MAIKVCHLITRMVIGGAQENTLLTVSGLAQKGYDPLLITGPSPKEEGSLLSKLKENNIQTILVPDLVRQPDLRKDQRAFSQIFSILKKEKYSLVHTHTSKAGVLGRVAARMCGVPVVVHTPHGHVFHSYFPPSQSRFFMMIERALALLTDRMIALTPTEMREHLQLGIGKPEQFQVIPSGIEQPKHLQEAFQRAQAWRRRTFPSSAKVIGTVARLSPVKGIPTLLKAFRVLAQKEKNLFLLLVGDGPCRKEYETVVKKWQLMSRVYFAGFQKDVFPYIAAMDVFVLASLNEGMGKAIVQAGYLKKAVVASAVGGIKDLILPGKTGFLFPAEDALRLAQVMLIFLSSPRLRQQLGENLYTTLFPRHFAETMVDEIIALYQKVLSL